MGLFHQKVQVGSKDGKSVEEVELLVDTGSTCTWVREDVLRRLGAEPIYRRQFRLATGEIIERDICEVLIYINGERLVNPVVVATEDDQLLLGAVTLESFSLAADPVNRTLVKVVASAMLLPQA